MGKWSASLAVVRVSFIACVVAGCGQVDDGPPALAEESAPDREGGGSTGEPSGAAPAAPGSPEGSTPGSSGPPTTDPTAGPTAFAWDESMTPSSSFALVAQDLLATCDDAVTKLDALAAPTSFVDSGTSASDPKRIASRAIWETLDDVMPSLGYCARLLGPAQAKARAAIVAYVAKLSQVYVGGLDTDATSDNDDPGNPINEHHLLPVVFAIDMIHAKLGAADLAMADALVSKAETRVAKFMSALASADNRRWNGWQTRAVVFRAAGALVRGDAAKASALAASFDQHVADTFAAPAGWKPSSCANLAAVQGYGSRHLQRSDAFNAHVQPLAQIAQLIALRPSFASAASQANVASAFEVLAPYATGQKTHEEYVCTTLEYDKAQRAAGAPGFSGTWNPASATVAFRFGRITTPDIKTWTDSFTTAGPRPWMDVFLAGKGDVVKL